MPESTQLSLTPLINFPLVESGDDLFALLTAALEKQTITLEDGDCLVLAQKIVSKSEGRYAYLNEVTVSDEATTLAKQVDKDPRLVQLILNESVSVLKHRPGALIVENKLGYVHANAGIDQSNIECDDDNPRVLLLPENPDQSATQLRRAIKQTHNVDVNIVINDSAGRAWRNGIIGFAIGTSGFQPIENEIGKLDLFGRPLAVTQVAVADEIAAAASLLMGQGKEGVPVVLVRGLQLRPSEDGSGALIRERQHDLFR